MVPPATERVLELFAQSGARWLVILGDVLNHGPRTLPEGYAPARAAERLNAVATQITAVRGNCDSEVDQMLLHFPITAPWQQILTQERRLFCAWHPLSGRDESARPHTRHVLPHGHTHSPVAQQQKRPYHFNSVSEHPERRVCGKLRYSG